MTTPDKNEQEPVAWRYSDVDGIYRYRGYVPNFDKEYALLKPIPLYTSAPNAQAIRAAALMEAEAEFDDIGATLISGYKAMEIVQSLITQSDKDALRELMMKVIDEVWATVDSTFELTSDVRNGIVDRVLEGK
jgi:hypothetical protein